MDFTGERFAPKIKKEELFLKSGKTEYTGVVYTLTHDGMSGTYIDFPGHIEETADGMAADNYPISDVYRVPASVIHLNFRSGDGAVTADDLKKHSAAKSTPLP
jgi:kynurenine formamidase